MQKITTCLWFDGQAEEAAGFYVSIFKHAKITETSYFGKEGFEVHRRPAGSVMVCAFELDGQSFIALNGGPQFKFNEAVSLTVNCKDQEEVDYYWAKLSAGGDPNAQACGWLKDKFGLSWQIVPEEMPKLINDPDYAASQRAFGAMMKMKKLDIAELKRAHAGK